MIRNVARLGGVPVMDLPDCYERWWGRIPVSHVRGDWLGLSKGFDLIHSPFQVHVKRLMDIALSVGLMIISLPIIIAAAIAVRVTSPGPILFKQQRVGQDGRNFTVLKFRTMVTGSETGDRYTAKKDARITPVGAFMRKSRLDELPQLWNVLRGDMSFIGPRAEWDELVSTYETLIPYYHLRHIVRPGLTGWAQVRYPYGSSVEDARMKLEYDLYYIKNQSPMLDLMIVLRTIRVVLFGVGSR